MPKEATVLFFAISLLGSPQTVGAMGRNGGNLKIPSRIEAVAPILKWFLEI